MKKIKLKNGKVVNIRKVLVSDAEKLIEYVKKVSGETDFLTFSPDEFKTTIKKQKEYLKKYTLRENCLALIAVDEDGRVIGMLDFDGGQKSRTQHSGEFAITVLKEYWGLGIGKAMINYLIDWAKNSGTIRKIDLKVRSDNERAITLYKNLGFVPEGEISRFFYIDGSFYSVLCMGLKID
ncbi:MAG: GNAT family N-acetyltransferase [Elusimicrobiota bacterium]